MPALIIFIIVVIILAALNDQAKEVKADLIEEALDRGDLDEVEDIENMDEEEIIDEYSDRF